ncbi:MAG TPA: hypothetical protein VJ974_02560 [Geopsychrobacteraceae bacterium]|nr:hypothetical protein [Geopsychrobacteraceae bacterium]
MKNLALLVSPSAKNAFFHDYLDVARAELAWLIGHTEITHTKVSAMDFFEIWISEDLLPRLTSLSFLHGVFERQGEQLIPLPVATPFGLDEDFVFGAKFKGKTNELLTQLLINVGLRSIDYRSVADVKLLDPMCGRATTLLWAMRYGMKAKGIEQDGKALTDIRQNVKKWCKVHRQKHQFTEGFVGKSNKQQVGKFVDFAANGASMRVICGDSVEASSLLKGERFDLLVSDLPYGVQHFTTSRTRNPLKVVTASAAGWVDSLKSGGVIVLAFNSYLPKREELLAAFTEYGMQVLNFSAAHRMSESIVRDVVILKKTG